MTLTGFRETRSVFCANSFLALMKLPALKDHHLTGRPKYVTLDSETLSATPVPLSTHAGNTGGPDARPAAGPRASENLCASRIHLALSRNDAGVASGVQGSRGQRCDRIAGRGDRHRQASAGPRDPRSRSETAVVLFCDSALQYDQRSAGGE